MKVVGQLFSFDKYKDRESLVLLDLTPDGATMPQFFKLEMALDPRPKLGEFIEFEGQVAGAMNGQIRFWPVKNVRILPSSPKK